MDAVLAGTLGFAWTCFIIEMTPGPNMTTLAVLSASRGRRAALAAVLGVAVGLGLAGIMAALGLAAVIDNSRVLYQALRWAGVAYLLWLAWEGWHDAEVSSSSTSDVVNDGSLVRYFRQGLLTNLLNPKAAIFYISVLPTFIDPARPLVRQTLVLTGIYVAIATAIHVVIILAAARARDLLDHPARNRVIRRVLSLTLAAVAVWLAWSTRR